MKKTELYQKCFDNIYKVENNLSLEKSKGYVMIFKLILILSGFMSGFPKTGNEH